MRIIRMAIPNPNHIFGQLTFLPCFVIVLSGVHSLNVALLRAVTLTYLFMNLLVNFPAIS